LRYDRCAKSFVGDGGRSDSRFSGGGSRSGAIGIDGGVRIGWRFFVSESESAWKNLLSGWVLPKDDSGGDGTLCFEGVSSCLPSA
jgi:hypothetical protein